LENCGCKETERLGIFWKNRAHQGDDDDWEEEDKKVRDGIELPCIEERRPSLISWPISVIVEARSQLEHATKDKLEDDGDEVLR